MLTFQPALDGPCQCFLPCPHPGKGLHATDNTTKPQATPWTAFCYSLLPLNSNDIYRASSERWTLSHVYWGQVGHTGKRIDFEIRQTSGQITDVPLSPTWPWTDYSLTSKTTRWFLCFAMIMRIKWGNISPSWASGNLTDKQSMIASF